MPTKDTDVLHASQFGVSNQCHVPEVASQIVGEEEDQQDTEDASWEKNYEKIWVEFEKRETKSQYKNVAAELKGMFGELTRAVSQSSSPDLEGCASKEQGKEEATCQGKPEVSVTEWNVDDLDQSLIGEGSGDKWEEIVKKDLKPEAETVAAHEPEDAQDSMEAPSRTAVEENNDHEPENGPEMVVRSAEEEPSEEEDENAKDAAASIINTREESGEEERNYEVDIEDSSDDDGDDVVITGPIARARSIMLHPIPEQRESSEQEDSQSEESPHTLQPPENQSHHLIKEVIEKEEQEAPIKAPVEEPEIRVLSPNAFGDYTREGELEVDHPNQSDGDRTVKPSSLAHSADDVVLAKSESSANPSSGRAAPGPSRSSTQSPSEHRGGQTSDTERKNNGPCQEVPKASLSASALRHLTPSHLSEEELQMDLQRFKHKVGRLRVVFQDMQMERARLRKKVMVMPVSMVIFLSSPALTP